MTEQFNLDEFLIAQAQTEQTLFTTQTPNIQNLSDGVPYELGMKFRSTSVGQITAIRFWKAASEAGNHTGKIWAAGGGTPLATVSFSNETASGWQQQALSTPLNIQANTTYVVSVNINSFYAAYNDELASSIVNGDLSSVADGNNGVYNVSPGAFPSSSYRNTNYYRDVVFSATPVSTISKVSGDNQSGGVGTTLANPLVVQVRNPAGSPQSGVTVNFAVSGGGGSVSPTSAVTNANGQASTTLTLGTTGGAANTVTATADNIGSVTFTAFTTRANPTNPNPIYLENQKPGNPDWRIPNSNYDTNGEICGYAGATSVNKGGSLPIKVSLGYSAQFTIDVYRLGYYEGAGARLVASSGALNGTTQPACTFDSTTRLIECNWATSYTLAIGNDWTSGLYFAKLTILATGKQSQIWFVVRDDSSTSDILFQSSFTTYLAYSTFGGYSLYTYNSIGGQKALKVSYDRPFSAASIRPEEMHSILRWERHMVRWLESQGYNVSYVTNMDVHENPQLLRQHKIFLSVGHDEYWSLEERNAVEQARDAGVNLAFFSANTCYWRVRFENSPTGGNNRIMACYKDVTDPVAPTNKFRSQQNNRPENALIGVMYTGDNGGLYWTYDYNNPYYGGYDFVVTNSSDPYYANTNLNNGDTLSGLVGYEWDAAINNGAAPSNLVVLSESAVNPNGSFDSDLPPGTNINISNAARYTAASGAKVFATGSVHWMFGLDTDGARVNREDIRAKQIAVNVLADLGAKPQSPDVNIIVP
ncbi:Ig domain-containing protein group 1 domain-containing protein [Chroococcidiopsis sp. CCALA 051]|uniref:N,N-dimethylformamidase beta subunit family domain-containing protein n=1 Tax=Chroococcidiopsis sp. CCALA 051 TaxID=869949 RepID=UPI000D0DF7CE|nr:N,N-dimethylformamidase beta subunit family domain-containing protein [Chroococcidiopsis sp. CCALA 051]PSM49551.1 Ig domain-containing protein group 1 domain-containing protein [Chroococcidiopsis sp. CCALA 051]